MTAAADLFDEATAQAIAARLVRVLAAVAADPQARLHAGSRCSMRPNGRRCSPGGTTRRRRCRTASVPELIAAQAARTPDAVAVVLRGRALSYGELDAAGGAAGAGYLVGRGAGPETVVGLCLEPAARRW